MDAYFADLKVELPRLFPPWMPFVNEKPFSRRVRLELADREIEAEGPVLWQGHNMVCHALRDGWRIASTIPADRVCLRVEQNYGLVTVWMPPNAKEMQESEMFMHLFRMVLECAFPFQGVVSLHASCVALEDGAVAFTAPSGTGKSARAQSWASLFDARLISGDRPAIRLAAGRAYACGVPWDGKESICFPGEEPLAAICEVRRAPFTRLRRLTAFQARRLLMRQCFIPIWDTEAAGAALNVIERLTGCVPIYRFFGDPGRESARIAYAGLFSRETRADREDTRFDMKIKEGFVLRNVVDEHIVMPVGKNIETFEGALVLSDVSAFIWEQLARPICREDLLELVLGEFNVERDVASSDLDTFLDKLRAHNVLEEE